MVPALRGPLPPEAKDNALWHQRWPALERSFARGRAEPVSTKHWYEQLQALFQLPPGEVPAGALGWLGEGRAPDTAYWLRADPVHLSPDRDQLVLFDASALSLEADEATALVESCNKLLAEDGLQLHAATPDRWYLQSPAAIDLQTVPVMAVAGRYLQYYLPQGQDASRWLSLSTELQMLLHQAPVNAAREAAGRLPVNGLWFWGAGALPEKVEGGWQAVIADEPVARGLAELDGLAAQELASGTAGLAPTGASLVVYTALAEALRSGDLAVWQQALAQFEQRFLEPALQQLRSVELGELIIETDTLRLSLNRRDLARFWRRPRPLQHYLEF